MCFVEKFNMDIDSFYDCFITVINCLIELHLKIWVVLP